MFSNDLYCRHIKTRACLGKGEELVAAGLILCSVNNLFWVMIVDVTDFIPHLSFTVIGCLDNEKAAKALERILSGGVQVKRIQGQPG